MPIFEYKCDKCEETKDKLVSRADADAGKEFDCGCEAGGTLKRGDAPTSAALRFKGRWFATTRGY